MINLPDAAKDQTPRAELCPPVVANLFRTKQSIQLIMAATNNYFDRRLINRLLKHIYSMTQWKWSKEGGGQTKIVAICWFKLQYCPKTVVGILCHCSIIASLTVKFPQLSLCGHTGVVVFTGGNQPATESETLWESLFFFCCCSGTQLFSHNENEHHHFRAQTEESFISPSRMISTLHAAWRAHTKY